MHQKSLTIKDTLLSSQASHPPEQPHPSQAGPPQGDPTNPTTPTPTTQIEANQQNQPKPNHHPKAATQSTLPDQPRLSNPRINPRNHPQENHQAIPAPSYKKGTRRSINTHQTTVKSCPQQSHNKTIRTPTSPHPQDREPKENTATTTPTTQIETYRPASRPSHA